MTKQKNNIIPIELTQEEQEFDNILTDKLIEVAYNPSMRKDFIIQASDTEQYRFFKEDIPSEIENKVQSRQWQLRESLIMGKAR